MSVSEMARKSELEKQPKGERNRDYFCILALLAILFFRFFPTIVLAKPISRLFLVSIWDSLFYPNRVGQSLPVDYAAVLLLLPYKFFVAQYWHHAIPLWNQFNGFGMPLLADPQALVFSPILFFFYLFPSGYTWNLTLIITLAIGAISTYFLCRELEFGFIAGLVSALLFAFCPWVQWQVEPLGAGICLTPFVLLFFARAGKRKSFWHAVIAGIAAALDVLSSHPEVCFVTISFACLLMCLVGYVQDRTRFNLLAIFVRIALAGVVTIGISAPMLLPFAEYLRNGETYKFDRVAPTDISWQALVANYLYPFFSVSSPYLGPLSWLGLVLAACFSKRSNRFLVPLLVCFGISIFAIAKLFPLSLILRLPPLSAVQPMYCFPEYLVFMSLISGLGISYLFSGLNNVSRARVTIAVILGILFLVVPLTFYPWHHDCTVLRFDQILQICHFHTKTWLLNVACSGGILLVWRLTANLPNRLKTLGWISVVSIGILNLAVVSYFSLPFTPSFEYPKVLPIDVSAANSARFISLGDHLFRPNTNQIYGLPTIRVHNPLFPKGFLAFMKACGAEFDDFNQYFPASINKLLDITGTRTVISEQPLLDENAVAACNKRPDLQIIYPNTMSLKQIRLFLDAEQKFIYCSLKATPNPQRGESYHLDCKIADADGKSLSFIERQPVFPLAPNQSIVFSAVIPAAAKDWTVSLQLQSDASSVPIQADKTTSSGNLLPDGYLALASSKQPELFSEISNHRFKEIARYGGSIVAYENKTAFARWFFVRDVHWVKTSDDALQYLKNCSAELSSTVVLEDSQKDDFEKLIVDMGKNGRAPWTGFFDQRASVKSSAQVAPGNIVALPATELLTECAKPALLVVSDLYYPGWKVFIDGIECQIFRADSIFRAVPVPAGKHHVTFTYSPSSFFIGLVLLGMTISILLFVFCLGRYKRA